MYDESKKLSFLSSIESEVSREQYRLRLERIAKIEERFGCSIEDMTDEQASEVAALFSNKRRSSDAANELFFARYKSWCDDNGIDFRPQLSSFKSDVLSEIRRSMVSGPDELQRRLDTVFLPESAKSRDNIFRCYLWMLFMGIERENTTSVKVSDVDLSIPAVGVGGEIYRIPQQAFQCFYVTSSLSYFNIYHAVHGRWQEDRTLSDRLLRGTRSDKSSHIYLESHITTVATSKNVVLRPRDIAYSGLMYRTFMREKETGFPDFTQYVQLTLSKSDAYKKQDRRSKQKRYQNVLSFVRKDYKNWKEAFAISL